MRFVKVMQKLGSALRPMLVNLEEVAAIDMNLFCLEFNGTHDAITIDYESMEHVLKIITDSTTETVSKGLSK